MKFKVLKWDGQNAWAVSRDGQWLNYCQTYTNQPQLPCTVWTFKRRSWARWIPSFVAARQLYSAKPAAPPIMTGPHFERVLTLQMMLPSQNNALIQWVGERSKLNALDAFEVLEHGRLFEVSEHEEASYFAKFLDYFLKVYGLRPRETFGLMTIDQYGVVQAISPGGRYLVRCEPTDFSTAYPYRMKFMARKAGQKFQENKDLQFEIVKTSDYAVIIECRYGVGRTLESYRVGPRLRGDAFDIAEVYFRSFLKFTSYQEAAAVYTQLHQVDA